MPYETLPHEAEIRIKASGGTRAGLLVAALRGMFAAAGGRLPDEEAAEESVRPFSVEAADFSSLLVDFLNEAAAASGTHRETYQDVHFELITDKKARGSFVGRLVTGFDRQIKAVAQGGLRVEKNAEGQWEAEIAFS